MNRIAIALLLALMGCSERSIKSDVESYGFDAFRDDALSFRERGELPKRITERFREMKAQRYLNGVVLIYEDSAKYRSGIYIDAESLDAWGGSGFEIEPWSPQVGWFTEKKREEIRNEE